VPAEKERADVILMESGSQELSRLSTAYATSFAFGLAFLAASAAGCDGNTALFRGVAAAIAAGVVGSVLAAPVVRVVLDAMARDAAAQRAKAEQEEAR
jgi:hypothetical protein